jgi:hypothetical protein
MTRPKIALVVAVALALLAGARAAVADDGPMAPTYIVGSGASVRPMTNTSIRMAAETVQAILYSRFAEYRIDFRFDNAGTTQTVLLGFPFDGPNNPPPLKNHDRYVAPAGFWANQDGRPLEVALEHGLENGAKYDYYTHSATFPPGETTITVGYLIAPHYEGGQDPSDLVAEFDPIVPSIPPAFAREFATKAEYDYTLHTGSYWGGPIGTAVLQWRLSPDFVGWGVAETNAWESQVDTSDPTTAPDAEALLAARIQSAMTTAAPDVYRWTLHDFNPTVWPGDGTSPYDLSFFFCTSQPTPKRGYANAYAVPSAHASSSYSSPPYSYPAENLVDGDPSTAWAEGANGGGAGQWVDMTFPKTRHLAELCILPGYAKRPELFTKYGRPKTLRFDFSDGTSRLVTLADSPTLQHFAVSAVARSARMTIVDVYHGTVSDRTYVSEVEFGSAPAPVFDDPGTLLAEARTVTSADATPSASAHASAARSRGDAPALPGAAAIPHLVWVALASALLGVGAGIVVWRKTPWPFRKR